MVAQTQHAIIPPVHNHTIVRWALATQAEFVALAGLIAGDIGKVAYVAETRVYHVLRNHDPISWDALNESATVAAAEYDATARTLTLTLSNGATIVATDVAVPEFPVADFALLDSAVTVTFTTSAGPVATNSRVIDVPARSTVRINNFPVYDANVNWEPGDVCRQGSSAYYATVLTTGVFNPAHWREITDSAVIAYINTQLASRPRVYVLNVAPTANEDSAAGYAINDLWLDIIAKKGYVATDVTVAAAVWAQFTPDIVVPWAEYNNGTDPAVAPQANFTDALALGNGAIAGATYAFAFLGNVTGADGISMGRLSSAALRGVAIGYNADAGPQAFAGGYNVNVSGSGGVGIGSTITVSGAGGVGIGSNNTISGADAVGVGRYVQVTSLYGTAVGNSARSTHSYSSSFGLLAYTQWQNQIRLGSGYLPQTGNWDSNAGLSENTRRVDTTDATPYSFEIASRGTGSNQSAYVEADIICHETSTGEMWHQKITALLKGGVTVSWSVIGAVSKSAAITSGGLTVSADLDLTNAASIKLQVTGEAGKNLTWTIQARIIAKVT